MLFFSVQISVALHCFSIFVENTCFCIFFFIQHLNTTPVSSVVCMHVNGLPKHHFRFFALPPAHLTPPSAHFSSKPQHTPTPKINFWYFHHMYKWVQRAFVKYIYSPCWLIHLSALTHWSLATGPADGLTLDWHKAITKADSLTIRSITNSLYLWWSNKNSTMICKLVDLISAPHQSDCRIPNWVSAKTVHSSSTNHGQTTTRFWSFFR